MRARSKILIRDIPGYSWDASHLPPRAGLKPPFAVCFEASAGYGYLFERLQRVARRVVVAHPGHLRLIFRSKRKNDRVDAEKLAKLLFLDEVPGVYVPSGGTRRATITVTIPAFTVTMPTPSAHMAR